MRNGSRETVLTVAPSLLQQQPPQRVPPILFLKIDCKFIQESSSLLIVLSVFRNSPREEDDRRNILSSPGCLPAYLWISKRIPLLPFGGETTLTARKQALNLPVITSYSCSFILPHPYPYLSISLPSPQRDSDRGTTASY